MPTTKRRYQITDTDEVARALDAAELRWPGEPRSRLVLRLITLNGAALGARNDAERERRLAAVDEHAGTFPGEYPPGYLEELRKDWPE